MRWLCTGISLLPELYQHLNPMPFDAAVQMETDLAEELRAIVLDQLGQPERTP